ncbi:MAG: cyclohexanecarboxylate-CoA ligase [Deltaproteobacteria bacterium]|nr:cyclohexanecarboxylate-CoA ligase [Deltaproteobacteria bacterium]
MGLIEEPDLWSLIEARAGETPELTFLLDEREREIGFGEFRDRALRAAAGLRQLGVAPGDRVSWQLPTWIESAVLVGALARLGAVQNPILPIYRERELTHIVGQVRPCLLAVPSRWRGFDYAAMAESVTADSDTRVLVCDRALPEADPVALPDAGPGALDLEAVRFILFTSGTTSAAKGALHSDASITAGALGVCTSLRTGPADRWAIPYPFTHISGIAMLKVLLMTGSSAIFIEQFEDGSPELMGRLGCTIAAGGTPLVLRYLELQRRQPDRPLFPKLKAAMAGAAPKPPQLHAEVRDELGGLGVVSCYGSTEVPFLSVSTTKDDDARLAGTEGRMCETAEVKIADEQGEPLPVGVAGEIRVKGPGVFKGYLDASLDAEAFDDEGFFRTGDLASVDHDGYVTITGRLKDVIIRNGENISAKEIEDILYGHDGIAEAAVIGLPDPVRGERCCAVVIAKGEARPTLDEIAKFCREIGLAAQKIPEQLEWVDEFPRNASGKVLKFELRERFE